MMPLDDNRSTLGVGVNAYMSGHNSKLTLEYKNQRFGAVDKLLFHFKR